MAVARCRRAGWPCPAVGGWDATRAAVGVEQDLVPVETQAPFAEHSGRRPDRHRSDRPDAGHESVPVVVGAVLSGSSRKTCAGWASSTPSNRSNSTASALSAKTLKLTPPGLGVAPMGKRNRVGDQLSCVLCSRFTR